MKTFRKKNIFTNKTLQPSYVFRFLINRINFACKLDVVGKDFDDVLGAPYLSYRVYIYSLAFPCFELPHLVSVPYDFNYRMFYSVIHDEVTSYITKHLFN